MNPPGWKDRQIRMARFDNLRWLLSGDPGDLEKHARMVRENHINFEWLLGDSGFVPGMGVRVIFQNDRFPLHPDLQDRDPLRTYVPIAHAAGITVFCYLNMHAFPYSFGDEHPDWEQRLADGRSYGRTYPLYGHSTTFCVNSGWRDYAFALIEETMRTGVDGIFLDGPVIYPGCCYCDVCREMFRDRSGAPVPEAEDWEDPRWPLFLRFREESLAEFLEDARQRVRKVNPGGGIFLNAGSWMFGNAVARSPWVLEPRQDITGAEAFFHLRKEERENVLDCAMAAKFLRAGQNPAVVFTHHALSVWHYCGLSPLELKRSFYQTAACGAHNWFGFFGHGPQEQVDQAMRPVAESYGFLAQNEDLLHGVVSAARVGLVHSQDTSVAYRSPWVEVQGEVFERDLIMHGQRESPAGQKARKQASDRLCSDEFSGLFYLLTRKHVPFDVLRGQDLSADRLSGYDALVLPNAACLGQAEREALLAFAERGGMVIASFETGRYGSQGQPLQDSFLRDLFGVEAVEGAFRPAAFEEYMQISPEGARLLPGLLDGQILPRWRYVLKVRPESGAQVLCWVMEPVGQMYGVLGGRSEYPGIMLKMVGRGMGVFIAGALGETYHASGFLEYEQILGGLLKALPGTSPQLLTNAPSTVQMELWRKGSSLLLHLVNNSGDMRRPFRSIFPIPEMEVRLSGVRAAGVRTARDAPVQFWQEGDDLVLRVGLYDQYDIVSIDCLDAA